MLPDAFDMAREQYYEELHHNLRQQRENEYNSPNPSIAANANQLSMGSILLDNVFGRPWDVECESIRQQSPFRDIKGWKVASFIIKAGEDIRKEALVMQIMSKLWTWFQEEIPQHLRPYLRPYTIMCVGGDAGIVECLPDVKSVSEVKKETDGFTTLRNFFERAFGPPVHPPYRPDYHQHQQPQQFGTVSFEKARDNFLRSLVGYSVVCYILQIKDRHNANVLMDREGHIMVSSFSIRLVVWLPLILLFGYSSFLGLLLDADDSILTLASYLEKLLRWVRYPYLAKEHPSNYQQNSGRSLEGGVHSNNSVKCLRRHMQWHLHIQMKYAA